MITRPYQAQILYVSPEHGTDEELVERFATEAEARRWLDATDGLGVQEKDLFVRRDGRWIRLDYPA